MSTYNQLSNSLLKLSLFVALCLLSISNLTAQTDTTGMSDEEKKEEIEYQESVKKDTDRKVDIPNNLVPQVILKDIYAAYESPVVLQAWRWVDEESVLLSYEVRINADGQVIALKYDKEGKRMKRERIEKLKEKTVKASEVK